MALALAQNEADAEDLAQETLAAAWTGFSRFRRESSDGSWLYGILLNKHREWRRRRKVPPARRRSAAADVEEALALLTRLPPSLRITAALFYVEDMSIEEIARSLGIPEATARWRLFRARETLKSLLGGAHGRGNPIEVEGDPPRARS